MSNTTTVAVRYGRINRQEAAASLLDQFIKAGVKGRVSYRANESESVAFIQSDDNFTIVSWDEAIDMLRGDESKLPVKLKVLPHGAGLPLPSYETRGSAGMDLRAAIPEDETLFLNPGRVMIIPTAISVALDEGFEIQVRPRSGLAAKHGVTVLNTPGTVDSDYRGEIKVILINHGSEHLTINRGDRIAQMVVAPVVQARWVQVEDLDETVRGEGGLGSTGRN